MLGVGMKTFLVALFIFLGMLGEVGSFIDIVVSSGLPASKGDEIGTDFISSPDFSVFISGPGTDHLHPGQLFVQPGESTHYTIKIQNVGTKDDSYLLKGETSQGWINLGILPDVLAVDAGEEHELVLEIKVPSNVAPDTEEIVNVIATSNSNENIAGQILISLVVKTNDIDPDGL